MQKTETENIIESIRARILDEYRKYGNDTNIDWAKMAAYKIYISLREIENRKKTEAILKDIDNDYNMGLLTTEEYNKLKEQNQKLNNNNYQS